MKRALALLAVSLGAVPAHAEVVFNGFGQVVVGSTLGNDHAFPIAGYQADPTFQPESLLALQIRADLSDDLSATAQMVSAGANQNDFTPKFEWAYVNYQIDDHWSIKGGRQRGPLYFYSDYLKVGEAYPWIRPPLSTYSLPISNFDGISLSGDYSLGRWDLRPKLIYGGVRNTLASDQLLGSQPATFDTTNAAGGAFEAVYDDWLSFRVSYFVASSTVHVEGVDQLLGLLQTLGDTATASALAADNRPTRFGGVSIQVDRDNVIAGGEYTYITIDNSFIPVLKGYYLLAGYHIGRFTPLITYGHAENKFTNPDIGDSIATVAPPAGYPGSCLPLLPTNPNFGACVNYQEYLGARNGVAQLVRQSHAIDDYYEVGVRYDLSSNTALKLDFTRYRSGVGIPSADLLTGAFTFNF